MSLARTLGLVALVASVASATLASLPAAEAKPSSDRPGGQDAEAIRRYRTGKQLFGQGKFAEALAELEASRELLPSPNTDLLVGHALRELGRKPEAMALYERVLSDAADRVRAGETRFKATLEEAGRWYAVLKVELGKIRLSVPDAPEGTTIRVDGEPAHAERDSSGGALVVSLWREPGATLVTVEGGGRELSEEVAVEAGQDQRLELRLPSGPSDAPATEGQGTGPSQTDPETADDESAMPPLATWITAGVGVVGLAFFAGFGASSASTANDLDECAPSCPSDMREEADEGSRNQTIANVSLVVGAVALAAASTIWIASALGDDDDSDDSRDPSEPEQEAPAEAALGLRFGSVVVRVRF